MPTLGTGTDIPVGAMGATEDLYIEGGPDIYYQDSDAAELHSPDSDGFYWGLSGTAAYPVLPLGCYDDLELVDTRTSTVVTCAALGNVAQMQRRDALEVNLTLKSLLPLANLTHLIGGGAVTHNVAEETEKMGIGNVPANDFYHVFMARVYDEAVGDFVSITLHKVQWVEATPLAMAYGQPWTYKLRGMALADSAKPAAQRFATWLRYDPSVL
jgi:hypothetical protein